MVEDVERFGTELKRCAFLDREVFEHAHVEVEAIGIARVRTASVAEGQAPRKREGCRIEIEFRVTRRRYLTGGRNPGEGAANDVGERSRADSIADTSIVTVGGRVGNGQRNSSRERFNT